MSNEMRFVQDDDGHWYLINNIECDKFHDLLDEGNHDELNTLFNMFRIGHPAQFTIIEARIDPR